jgi:phosphopantetheinyl transferase (holo-ACP synthase)
MWAAAAGGTSAVGIDAAEPGEFPGSYPFSRAFVYGEVEVASDSLRIDFSQAAALIWSVKEASVKALGCGFHFFGPAEVRAVVLEANRDSVESRATLSKEAAQLGRGEGTMVIPVRSFRYETMWVSVALMRSAG